MPLIIPKLVVKYLIPGIFISFIIIARLLYYHSRSNYKLNSFSEFLMKPFSLEWQLDGTLDHVLQRELVNKKMKSLLVLFYSGIALFLVGNLIGLFYFIYVDLFKELSQGNTGAIREWTAIIINNPFNGEWKGSIPWISFERNLNTWDWILFTSANTSNPSFMGKYAISLIQNSIVIAIIFLIPLLWGPIRTSFVPSLLFYFISMSIATHGIFEALARLMSIEFKLETIQYGYLIVTEKELDVIDPYNIMLKLLGGIILLFLLFLFLGRRIGKVHYPDIKSSQRWFIIYMCLYYWISFIILLL